MSMSSFPCDMFRDLSCLPYNTCFSVTGMFFRKLNQKLLVTGSG